MTDMTGRICMVTGGNGGIGKETSLALATMGAHVVIISRNLERGEQAVADILKRVPGGNVDLLQCDFSSQASIHQMTSQFNAAYPRLDVLVNNAGLMNLSREVTVDGLEETFAVNHLGYFMCTLMLMDSLAQGRNTRVINVASDAHRGATINFDDIMGNRKYSGYAAYGQSKLANVLFTYELDRRLAGSGITTNALHPGFVGTGFGANNGRLFAFFYSLAGKLVGRSPEKGAETTNYLASSPEVEGQSGHYYVDCKPVKSSPESYDVAAAERLWALSLELTQLPDLSVTT